MDDYGNAIKRAIGEGVYVTANGQWWLDEGLFTYWTLCHWWTPLY